MLVDLVGKSGLRFRSHDEIQATALDGSRKPAALISVLPMTAYALDDKKEAAPFLLEFPVRLGVEGTLEQITAFFQSINVAGQFFGVRGFEILSPAPSKASSKKDGKAETLQLKMRSSSQEGVRKSISYTGVTNFVLQRYCRRHFLNFRT